MRLLWSAEAEAFLLELEVREAMDLMGAAEAYAESGRGFVRTHLDDFGTRGLYLPNHVLLFVVEEPDAMRVLDVRARHRPPGH